MLKAHVMKCHTLILSLALFLWDIQTFAQSQNSLHFLGDNDYVETSFGGIPDAVPRTVEAWIKADLDTTEYQRVISYGGHGGNNSQSFMLMIAPTGELSLSQGINPNNLTAKSVLADSQWHHVAVTFDTAHSPDIHVYIDGQLDTAFEFATAVNTRILYSLKFGMGSRPPTTNTVGYYSGNIDEVRIWNYARSDTDIISNKDKEICSNHTGLVAYYRFNHGNVQNLNPNAISLRDHSSGGNDGTLYNFNLYGSTSNWDTGTLISSAPDTKDSFSVVACDIYTAPSGEEVESSQEFTDIIPNAMGCDSILTIDVTINKSDLHSHVVGACDSFVSYSGQNIWRSSGIYLETYTNEAGCDSIEEYLVTIDTLSYTDLEISNCYEFTSPSGRHSWTQSGTYMDTLVSQFGCDSILQIELSIFDSTKASHTITSCDVFTGPSGQAYTQSGVYRDILVNHLGCDSIITLDLTIVPTTHSNLSLEACHTYTSPSGKLFNTSGTYYDTITNNFGCDSLMTIDITIVNNTAKVTRVNDHLEANAGGDSYQWLDCGDGYAKIQNENGRSYTPSQSGWYAAIVEKSGCIDTSACFVFEIAGVEQLDEKGPTVYPNPSINSFTIEINGGHGYYVLMDQLGREVRNGAIANYITIETKQFHPGLYKLIINDGSTTYLVNLLML